IASGDVWRALPTTAWSISAGSMPVRSKRARAACAPRSIAEMSAKEPLYSAIGVRTPSTRTRSRESITDASLFFSRLSSGRGRQSMEAPAPAMHVRRGIETGTEENVDTPSFRVDPETVACETGVTESRGRKGPPGAAAERPSPPAEGERASAFQGMGHALRLQHAPRRQPFRAQPPQIAGAAEKTGMAANAATGSEAHQEAGVAVLRQAGGGRTEIRHIESLPCRQPDLLARPHTGHREIRSLPGRRRDRGESQRSQNPRADDLRQGLAGLLLRRGAPKDITKIAVGARLGSQQLAFAAAAGDQ